MAWPAARSCSGVLPACKPQLLTVRIGVMQGGAGDGWGSDGGGGGDDGGGGWGGLFDVFTDN